MALKKQTNKKITTTTKKKNRNGTTFKNGAFQKHILKITLDQDEINVTFPLTVARA